MHAKRRLAGTAAAVALLLLCMWPAARLLSAWTDGGEANDAAHRVEPVLALLAQSPLRLAQTAVEPMIEIEQAWAIEDARLESDAALVAGMRNGGHELGYDSASRTFYCTLGVGLEAWPELALHAQPADGAQNLRVAWIDDYSFDDPAGAIRDGYRYELLAYTDEAYAYFGLVFTGLPVVTLETPSGQTIGDAYAPARVGVVDGDRGALESGAMVHLRGGGYDKGLDKLSYRIEFHGLENGRDRKRSLSVLGMEADTDWLLISNASDETGMRNHLCWDLWNRWNPDGDAPALLESRMVEVFVNDTYKGLYQVMQRIRADEEIERLGGDPQTDYLYRIIRDIGIESRPVQQLDGRWYELRKKPAYIREERQFERIRSYVTMNRVDDSVSDEAFAALAQACIDVDTLMNYYAFSQAADLGYENVDNNVFIWAIRQDDGRYVYHLSPWDMDNGLPAGQGTPEEAAGLNLMMRMPYRILNLNLMDSRAVYAQIWAQKRETLLGDDALYQWFDAWETYINDSGAYLRESETWWGGARTLNLQQICANMIDSMGNMDRQMQELWPTDRQIVQP